MDTTDGFLSKIGKGIKKAVKSVGNFVSSAAKKVGNVAKKVLPIAAPALAAIPGVGPILAGVGGMLGGAFGSKAEPHIFVPEGQYGAATVAPAPAQSSMSSPLVLGALALGAYLLLKG